MWSPDGRELFYLTTTGELVSVTVDTESGFSVSRPENLPVTGSLLGRQFF